MLEPPATNTAGWVFSDGWSALLLLVARILANHHHAPFALDDLALLTDGLD
jgi:hypothetical protein